MASNFPTSLDSFTDPTSGSSLASPSHSGQHIDLNDAVEKIEAKIGIGSSPASSAANGQILVANGSGSTTYGWGLGRLLQVVQSADDTTLRTSTTTTFADTGLTLNITPKATTSKILCLYVMQTYTNGSLTGVGIRLVRGATTLVTDIDNAYGTASGVSCTSTFYYLDSPATTSSTTYKVQFNRNQGANTAYLNASGAGVSRLIAFEISF